MHENEVLLKNFLKFEDKTKNALESFEKELSIIEFYKIFNKTRKKPIKNSVINILYEDPEKFFSEYKILLKDTSYYDISDNSVFAHYFNILYKKFINANKNKQKQNLYIKQSIYEKNFNLFFKDQKKYLLIQDISLDTPLHKLVKFNDKLFFLKIFMKLNELGVVTYELLSLKNINEKNICQYIFEEIKNKYKYLIINNNNYYKYVNKFAYLIKTSYPNIFNEVNNETEKIIHVFINNYKYDLIKYNNFDNLYKEIYTVIKAENNQNIFNYIFYPFTSGINFLNYLYQICKTNEDYNKLLNLILENISKKEIQKNICVSDLCIINHMIYSFRKMNSNNEKGGEEINYCILLIKYLLPKIINGKNIKNIIQILNFGYNFSMRKSFKNGLIDNIKYNSNLNFEKKVEILIELNEVTNGFSDQEIGEDFSIYFFFKLLINKQICSNNIIRLYNKDLDFRKILNELSIIVYLYDYLYYLCNIYDKKSFDKYINLLNEFIINGDPKLFSNYKIKYNLSNKNIKQIMEIIQLFIRKCYDNQYKHKIEGNSKDLEFEEQIQAKFLQSEQYLGKLSLIYFFKKKKFDFLALRIIFSFKYDYSEFLNSNNKHIINIINKYEEKFIKYLYSIDFSNINPNKEIERKIIFQLSILLNKNEISLIYKPPRIIKVNKNNFQKLCLVCFEGSSYKKFLSRMNYIIYKYINIFLEKWNKPVDYINIINDIIDDILCYCKYFINLLTSKKQIINIINFFFDEFIYLIKPELKINYEYCRTITLNYLSTFKDEQNDYQYKFHYQKEFKIGFKSSKSFYFLMMLINIKIKFGDYNPRLLFNICNNYFSFIDVFLLFIDGLKENIDKKEFVKHFFLTKEPCNNYIRIEIEDFIWKNISSLKQLKNSLFFIFFIEMRKNMPHYGERDNNLFPIFNSINMPENINIFYNIIFKGIEEVFIYYFEFLKQPHEEIQENNILKRIELLKLIPIYCHNISIKEQNEYENNTFFSLYGWYPSEYTIEFNIFMNLYKFLKKLKNSKISLFYICDNICFIG